MKSVDKYNMIKKYNYFNTSDENSIDISYYIYNRLMENNFEMSISPINIGIRITNRCKFNCKGCFVNKKEEDMNFENFKKIFNNLPQKPFYVYLTGGDPFLNEDIFDMIEYLHFNRIKVNIHTTGIVEEKTIYRIFEVHKKISSMQISIDSISRFDKIRINKNLNNPISKIQKFIKTFNKYIDLKVNFVLRNENKNDIFEVIDFCDKCDIKRMSISPLISREKCKFDIFNMDYYFDIIKYISNKNVRLSSEPFCHPMSLHYKYTNSSNCVERFYCPAGKTECEIDVNGNVYACPFLYNDEFKFGNIFYENFNNIWKKENKLTSLEWSKNKKCLNCDIYDKCGGGCCAYAYINGSDYDLRCNL